MREALEMSEATSDYCAAPLEENLFEWHFTVRGPEDSDFQVEKIFQWKLEGKYFISLAGRYLPREDPGASRISHEASRHHSAHGTQIDRLSLEEKCGLTLTVIICSRMAGLRLVRRSACPYPATTLRPGSPLGPSERPCWPSSPSCPAPAREPSAVWTTLRRRGERWPEGPGPGPALSVETRRGLFRIQQR